MRYLRLSCGPGSAEDRQTDTSDTSPIQTKGSRKCLAAWTDYPAPFVGPVHQQEEHPTEDTFQIHRLNGAVV